MRTFLLSIIFTAAALAQQHYTVEGVVTDSISGLPVARCNVRALHGKSGTVTDSTGRFTFRLPPGRQVFQFSHIGYHLLQKEITLSTDTRLPVSLYPASIVQEEVTVTGKKENITFTELEAKDLRNMPVLQDDILRSVQSLPGVVTNNELSSGYNVRGGTYDDNLIYLNGFEIYRPFLLRAGIEENQTLINPEMVERIQFYNGSFPATFGDKMSSALQVDYKRRYDDTAHGTLRADLLHMGLSFGKSDGPFTLSLGARYSYPGSFLQNLQTTGSYSPFFGDVQGLFHYAFTGGSEAELFVLRAENKFRFIPSEWIGHFRSDRGEGMVNGAAIVFLGRKHYQYSTLLAGARVKLETGGSGRLLLALNRFSTGEAEDINLSEKFYYIPDAMKEDNNREYLKTRYEQSGSNVRLVSDHIDLRYEAAYGAHRLTAGAALRFTTITDVIDESLREEGQNLLIETPYARYSNARYAYTMYTGILQDEFTPGPWLRVTAGARYTYSTGNGEGLFSPRGGILWYPRHDITVNASAGYYYQPPSYAEFRGKPEAVNRALRAQKAVHYIVGAEQRVGTTRKYRAELFYKKMNRLIPYYLEEQRYVYSNSNANEGYAWGGEFYFDGEIINGLRSMLGYSLLNTRERPEGSGRQYVRRLTDQTHTLQVFLQDKIRKHPNWQSHMRLLLGSGQLYYDRVIVTDPSTGKKLMQVSYNNPLDYFLFYRVDVGLSAKYPFRGKSYITVVAEIMNMFNQYNIASYRFIQVFNDIAQPVRVPEVLTPRFYNVKVYIEF